MKVIVDIKNKTLKMLENERSIFKGEYSADKLELYINKQLENEYPVITGLLSNGRRIGPYTTDSSYGIEQIDGMTYTTAEFTLSKENGFTLSEGLMQVTVWLYTTKNSEVVSKIAIGNITFSVVNTTAFNDGDVIISGDVEGTVVNLKVEMENLQAKTEQYLPLNGGKPMTGDLNMDDHDIKNVSTIGVDGPITTATKLLVHDENDDIIQNDGWNYHASSYYASGIEFTTGQEQSIYNLYFPKKTGTLLVKNTDSNIVYGVKGIVSDTQLHGVLFDAINDETIIYNPSSEIGLASTTMYEDGVVHFLKFPDTSTELTDDGSWNTYTWNLPKKSGTIALQEDIPTKTSQLTNDSNYATTNQLFSKNYNDLTNKPSIPSSTSQLTNNSGFITNAVNNLTNYYLKSETYTKSEVQQLLSTISSLKLEVVTNLPTTNISSNTIYLKPLDSAKENNIYEEYIYINSKWETIGTTAVDLSNYALKTDIPTKTSELTNDSNFLTKHQDISGKADKTELNNYIPKSGVATSKDIVFGDGKALDIVFTNSNGRNGGIEILGDSIGTTTITGKNIAIEAYTMPTITLNGKPVALQENIPTKLSQLEQDVELGVSEEDVMNIIENNAEQTNTLDIGTSATFNPESDKQIPTSKAVADMMANSGGSANIIDLGWVAQDLYSDEAFFELVNIIKSTYGLNNKYIFTGLFNDEKSRFIAFYIEMEDKIVVEDLTFDGRYHVIGVSNADDMIVENYETEYYPGEGINFDGYTINSDIHYKTIECNVSYGYVDKENVSITLTFEAGVIDLSRNIKIEIIATGGTYYECVLGRGSKILFDNSGNNVGYVENYYLTNNIEDSNGTPEIRFIANKGVGYYKILITGYAFDKLSSKYFNDEL